MNNSEWPTLFTLLVCAMAICQHITHYAITANCLFITPRNSDRIFHNWIPCRAYWLFFRISNNIFGKCYIPASVFFLLVCLHIIFLYSTHWCLLVTSGTQSLRLGAPIEFFSLFKRNRPVRKFNKHLNLLCLPILFNVYSWNKKHFQRPNSFETIHFTLKYKYSIWYLHRIVYKILYTQKQNLNEFNISSFFVYI